MLTNIGHKRISFDDFFLHLKARHMVLVGPYILFVDVVFFQEIDDTATKGIDTDFRNIRYVIPQAGHADGIIQFSSADVAGKVFDRFQRSRFFSDEKSHRFTNSKHILHFDSSMR